MASVDKFSKPKLISGVCTKNIVKIGKNMTEIAKNSMNFGGHLSHEFAIFGKFFCIDLLNVVQ